MTDVQPVAWFSHSAPPKKGQRPTGGSTARTRPREDPVTQDQNAIAVKVTQVSGAWVVAIEVRGRYAPMASCGSAAQAAIVKAGLEWLAHKQPAELREHLAALPRTAVPGAEPEITVTRGAGEHSWTITGGRSTSASTTLNGAAESVMERLRLLGGRAVVTYRDDNRPSQHPIVRSDDQRPSSRGATWSDLMAGIDELTSDQ
jgi:hypothetical protein